MTRSPALALCWALWEVTSPLRIPFWLWLLGVVNSYVHH